MVISGCPKPQSKPAPDAKKATPEPQTLSAQIEQPMVSYSDEKGNKLAEIRGKSAAYAPESGQTSVLKTEATLFDQTTHQPTLHISGMRVVYDVTKKQLIADGSAKIQTLGSEPKRSIQADKITVNSALGAISTVSGIGNVMFSGEDLGELYGSKITADRRLGTAKLTSD
jgi:hypothetical protein